MGWYQQYKRRIANPIWLRMIKDQYDKNKYKTEAQMIKDIEQVYKNCKEFHQQNTYALAARYRLQCIQKLKKSSNKRSNALRSATASPPRSWINITSNPSDVASIATASTCSVRTIPLNNSSSK